MTRTKIEDQALRLLNAFERAGKSVGRVTVDGKEIELFLANPATMDDIKGLRWVTFDVGLKKEVAELRHWRIVGNDGNHRDSRFHGADRETP